VRLKYVLITFQPQVLPGPDPFGEGSPRGTKRRRSSSEASENSHASDPSSPIPVPTPHSSPPSEMKYPFAPIRKVRKLASASTTLQLQASGPALSSQEQLKEKVRRTIIHTCMDVLYGCQILTLTAVWDALDSFRFQELS
jgi:hypothetical protein